MARVQKGEIVVVETDRRLHREQSYGFVHALYGIFFTDGRVVISLPPGSRDETISFLKNNQADTRQAFAQGWLDNLLDCTNHARSRLGLPPADRIYEIKIFACNDNLVQRFDSADCIYLRDDRIPPYEGLSLPVHCFPDGNVYGIVLEDHIVSVAYAHPSGLMEDQVVDLAVETAAPYRRSGYARAVVSAVTVHMTSTGGEALYTCSLDNLASIATAISVGYELYGNAIVVATPSV